MTLIEQVAKAICKSELSDIDSKLNLETTYRGISKHIYDNTAKAAIQALIDADVTKEMIIAGEDAIDDHKDSTYDSGCDGFGHNTYEFFTTGVELSVYKAMLRAALEEK